MEWLGDVRVGYLKWKMNWSNSSLESMAVAMMVVMEVIN